MFTFGMVMLVVGLAGGVIGTLVFQGGERSGRLVQHARDLTAAWIAADEALATEFLASARVTSLEFQLQNERDEFETRYANMARALDVEVRKNHTVESRRVQAWKALDSAICELHSDPDPKCAGCGDSIAHDPYCFVCGLHEVESTLNQSVSIAQA